MPRGKTYGEVCAWPGCMKAISWSQVWCHRHWRMVPPEERQERMDAIREARRSAGSGEGTGAAD